MYYVLLTVRGYSLAREFVVLFPSMEERRITPEVIAKKKASTEWYMGVSGNLSATDFVRFVQKMNECGVAFDALRVGKAIE